MTRKKRSLCVLATILFAGCAPQKQFDFAPGIYNVDHPQEEALGQALRNSSVTITLSGHAGITLPSETGKGWDDNLSMEQLKKRLAVITDREQATILEEKNYTGEDELDQKVAALLKKLGFKTVIIQQCHSSATIIGEVIRNEPAQRISQ